MTRPRRIAFVTNWEPRDATYRWHCFMTPGRAGAWGGLRATRSVLGADVVVIHQGWPSRRYDALIPPWKRILLRHEPSYVTPGWPRRSLWPAWLPPRHVQRFDVGDVPMAATWWINMDYDTLAALPAPPKTRALSAIASAKHEFAGHRRRLAFLAALAAARPDAVDLYGTGLATRISSSAYKGALDRDTGPPLGRRCKFDGLRDYRYSLCIENGRERNYYTEKIVDAWLSWTVPLYWGCPNLADYYPREAFIEIDIDAPDAVDEAVRRSREPVSRETLEAVAEARHLALTRFGVWGTVERLVRD